MAKSPQSNHPQSESSPIRLVKNTDQKTDQKDGQEKSNGGKDNSLVKQLQLLADSIDAQVKELLEM